MLNFWNEHVWTCPSYLNRQHWCAASSCPTEFHPSERLHLCLLFQSPSSHFSRAHVNFNGKQVRNITKTTGKSENKSKHLGMYHNQEALNSTSHINQSYNQKQKQTKSARLNGHRAISFLKSQNDSGKPEYKSKYDCYMPQGRTASSDWAVGISWLLIQGCLEVFEGMK